MPKAFSMYGFASKIGDGPVNAKADYAIDNQNRATLGKNFVQIFGKYIDNPDTPETETFSQEDLLLKQSLKETTGRTKGSVKMATSGNFIISKTAYNAIKAFIDDMPNDAVQKAYIQYLPKNLYERPKMGFSIPVSSWFRGKLKDFTYDTLLSQNLFIHQINKLILQIYQCLVGKIFLNTKNV